MNQQPIIRSIVGAITVLITLAFGLSVHAHPYASGITGTNATGDVGFFMNEDGATVTVTFEDASLLTLGVLAKGSNSFNIGTHTSYKISCYKQGSGAPTLISDNAFTNSVWTNASGMAVSKNPKIGSLFGRIYAGNHTAFTGTGGNGKLRGIYALNADQTFVTFSAAPTGTNWAGSVNANFTSPGRIRVAPNGKVLVADGKGTGGANRVYLFEPDLSSSVALLGPSPSTGAGDVFGTPVVTGSLETGDLVLYTASAGEGAPSDTNCILGPLTSPGSFNCIFRYNIGSGPLPWTKRPDYAYTVGLDGIAQLRPEVDVTPDGKVYAAFGRGNLSNPDIQILRPIQTTNGITGDLVNKDIQDAMKSSTNWLYTSGVTPPFNNPPVSDPWNGVNAGGAVGMYGGVRVSPDGNFFASVDFNLGITLSYLTNGIPNDGTIFGIVNASSAGAPRGIDWDAANNLWVMCGAQLPAGTAAQTASPNRLRCYSLGLTTTCISSNDWTGTNGSFVVLAPPVTASLAVINPIASQNYVNNTINAGTPIPGVFRISLTTNDTTSLGATFVGFVRTGTAIYTNNYTINTNELPNGVTVLTNGVIFPAGVFGVVPGSGSNGPNWNVDVKIIPTPIPVSGTALSVSVRLNSGTNFSAAAPLSGNISIINTGPQLLQLVAATPATLGGMNRGIPNDYARFNIIRLGDTNGPGNDAVNPIVARTLTVTNIDYLAPSTGVAFMANLGVDYTAGAQNFNGALPVDGSPGIVFPAGLVTNRAMIGNPVKHTDTSLTRTNLQVVISLTNTVAIGSPASTTNVVSSENYPYSVAVNALTLNEFDNAVGGEVILWSNPLTNSFDSTNWTLVHASINQGASPTLPTVISNYDNSATAPGPFMVAFGDAVNNPNVNNDFITVPQSDVMLANGWSNALRVAVNKDPNYAGESAVNLYPQIPGAPWNGGSNQMVFQGNYALRFDMYLRLYQFGLNNPTIGTPAREFAAFGINHKGTNANWRLDVNPRADGTGARPINADGEWCTIGAASGSITPADYDMFISPAFALVDANGAPIPQGVPFTTNLFTSQVASPSFSPFTNAYQNFPGNYSGVTNVFANAGVPNDQVSANNNAIGGAAQNGIIKNPPFSGINANGGAPANAWIDVSLELTRQTNLTLKVAQQTIFSSSIINPAAGTANPIAPFHGTPMLGYLDPNINISDYSAFVYFSNVRVVELSPFIPWTNQPVAGLIVTQGSSFTLSSGATFASNPLTNTWFRGTTNGPNSAAGRENGTPTVAMVTNVFAATNGIGTLTVNNIQGGTNYISKWSDQAGAITNYITVVEVIAGPGDKTVAVGNNTSFTVVPSGNAPPTSFQWKTNGVNLVNTVGKYGGVTTATLFITNATPADAGIYSCTVVNAHGNVTPSGTLIVDDSFEPYQFTNFNDQGATIAMAFTTADSGDTTASFALQSCGVVNGTYTNYPFGSFSGSNPNFIVTVPKTNVMMYFRLKHN
jgi:hypothetical protein